MTTQSVVRNNENCTYLFLVELLGRSVCECVFGGELLLRCKWTSSLTNFKTYM